MNKKYLKTLGVAALCTVATTAISAAPTFAAESDSSIQISYRADGVTDLTTCYLYDADGFSDFSPECDASYGSYDAATRTLTLKSGINSLPNSQVRTYMRDNINITSDSDIATHLSLSGDTTLDFGSHAYTEKPYSLSSDTIIGNKFIGNLIIKSGKLNLQSLDTTKNLEILGGEINLNANVLDKNIGISSGNMKISGGSIRASGYSILAGIDDILITGGTIIAENITTGFSPSGTFTMTGGKVNLKATSNDSGFGINGNNEDKNITINGGELTIDGFDFGIVGDKNKMIFNGGTTIVKNSKTHSVWITPAKDPEHDIIFGDNMGIKEDTYVFWEDRGTNPSTGIAESGNVTITSGYTYRRHYGWAHIDGDVTPTDPSHSNIPTVPDTGIFGMDGKTATIVGAIAALPAIAITGYGIRFAIKRNKQRVRF